MTLEELKKGEHVTVEYKLDIPQERDKYLKSAVAFANGAGGKLVFGVKNQTWDVIGFPDDELFQKYGARISFENRHLDKSIREQSIYVTGQQLPGIGWEVFILEVHKDSPLYQLAGGYFFLRAPLLVIFA